MVEWNPWLLAGGDDLELRFLPLLATAALPSSSEQPPDPGQLAALRARVASALGSGDKRIVVTIDDVDRLGPERRGEVVRVLATVGGLPNLVFVLALRRDPAAAGVTQKVVQVEIDLPLPDRSSLQQMFIDRHGADLAEARDGGLVHPEYWVDICAAGIDPFLNTPRDVVRLVNAVSATYPAVKGEVNPIDFTALETLRLFSPLAYDAVRRRPAAFLLPHRLAARRTARWWPPSATTSAGWPTSTTTSRLAPTTCCCGCSRGSATCWARACWQPCRRSRGGRCCCSPARRCSRSTSSWRYRRGAISNADLQSKLEHFGDTNQFAATLLELAREPGPDASGRLQAFMGRLENHIGENATAEELQAAVRACSRSPTSCCAARRAAASHRRADPPAPAGAAAAAVGRPGRAGGAARGGIGGAARSPPSPTWW